MFALGITPCDLANIASGDTLIPADAKTFDVKVLPKSAPPGPPIISFHFSTAFVMRLVSPVVTALRTSSPLACVNIPINIPSVGPRGV